MHHKNQHIPSKLQLELKLAPVAEFKWHNLAVSIVFLLILSHHFEYDTFELPESIQRFPVDILFEHGFFAHYFKQIGVWGDFVHDLPVITLM
jgi:hypothetical protein